MLSADLVISFLFFVFNFQNNTWINVWISKYVFQFVGEHQKKFLFFFFSKSVSTQNWIISYEKDEYRLKSKRSLSFLFFFFFLQMDLDFYLKNSEVYNLLVKIIIES